MGLQRMGGDARIVSPDFVQQDIPRDHAVVPAVEEFEDVRFFLGQTNFPVIFCDQELHRRFERIGPKRKNSIFRLLMLAQLRTDPGQKNREFEGLVT